MSTAAPAVAATTARRSGAGRAGRILSSLLLLAAAMALVAVIVAGASGMRVRVEQSDSMAPAIRTGDLVLIRDTPIDRVRPGDVIGVRGPSGRVIVHRVERLAGDAGFVRVTTRGDANPTSEEWRIPRAGSVALVEGTVPRVGSVVSAVKGPVAAAAVLLAGLLLAISALRSIWRRG